MPRRITYRLLIIREDGTRHALATGIPEARATAMQIVLDSQMTRTQTRLILELEKKPGASRPPGEPELSLTSDSSGVDFRAPNL